MLYIMSDADVVRFVSRMDQAITDFLEQIKDLFSSVKECCDLKGLLHRSDELNNLLGASLDQVYDEVCYLKKFVNCSNCANSRIMNDSIRAINKLVRQIEALIAPLYRLNCSCSSYCIVDDILHNFVYDVMFFHHYMIKKYICDSDARCDLRHYICNLHDDLDDVDFGRLANNDNGRISNATAKIDAVDDDNRNINDEIDAYVKDAKAKLAENIKNSNAKAAQARDQESAPQ